MAKATILIVDDEHEVAENQADLLEFEGYEVVISPSGEDALDRIASRMPDLVLLDSRLAGADGLEVLPRLKEANPSLAVLVVSATSQGGTRERADEAGAVMAAIWSGLGASVPSVLPSPLLIPTASSLPTWGSRM